MVLSFNGKILLVCQAELCDVCHLSVSFFAVAVQLQRALCVVEAPILASIVRAEMVFRGVCFGVLISLACGSVNNSVL